MNAGWVRAVNAAPSGPRSRFLTMLLLAFLTGPAHAFCGAYVASADSALHNRDSLVVLTREGTRSTLTLVNDVHGADGDFGLLLPVPPGLDPDRVQVLDPEAIRELDRYSAPRLVEYGEACASGCNQGPCLESLLLAESVDGEGGALVPVGVSTVQVEAVFSAGDYELVLLSGKRGEDLQDWLADEGFAVSPDAGDLLQDYLDAGSWFLAARLGVEGGPGMLAPLQLSYESEAVTLPLRLGTLNSDGEQALTLLVIGAWEQGAWAIANYPEAEIVDECLVQPELYGGFAPFYEQRVAGVLPDPSGAAWATEYAWGGGGCDPCPAEPPEDWVFEELGATRPPAELFVTRLQLRYAPEAVDQDLALYPSGVQSSLQQRYIRHEPELEDSYPACDPLTALSCTSGGLRPLRGALLLLGLVVLVAGRRRAR